MIAARAWWLVATLAEPAARLLLHARRARGKELAAHLGERRGKASLPRPAGAVLWLHAASVGETISVLPLLEALCQFDTELNILLTTGTVTSRQVLAQKLQACDLSPRVRHQFDPLDVPRWVRRFLHHWRPQAAALVESELWPNLIAGAHASGIPLALLNARLSARSVRGWRILPGLARGMLGRFHWIAARSDEDATRLRRLGKVAVESLGDLKASAPALAFDRAELERLRRLLAGRPVLLAASTHAGEEALIAEAHAIVTRSLPALLTIIAPRHPDRGAAIADELGNVPRRSLGQDPSAGPSAGLWICDTLGEMGLLYRLSSLVFIGNSLAVARPGGGHNPFEPARVGCPLAIGPCSFNFDEAVAALAEAGALTRAPTPAAIAHWAVRLLADPQHCQEVAQAAERVATEAASLAPCTARRLLALIRPAHG